MSAKVKIPTSFRNLTGGSDEVQVPAGTVGEIVTGLKETHPDLTSRLLDEAGQLRRFVNVFVADEDMRFLQGLDTPVRDDQVLTILPAVAGG